MKIFILDAAISGFLLSVSFDAFCHNSEILLALISRFLSVTLTVIMLFKHKEHIADAIKTLSSLFKKD